MARQIKTIKYVMGEDKFTWTVGQVINSMNKCRIHSITESNLRDDYYIFVELINDKNEVQLWKKLVNMHNLEITFNAEDLLCNH